MNHRLFLLLGLALGQAAIAQPKVDLPTRLKVVLENTQPVDRPLDGRLPMFVLPISGALSSLPLGKAEEALGRLAKRGIGYSVNWNHNDLEASLKEGLRIGRMQQQMGGMVSVHATSCLYCSGRTPGRSTWMTIPVVAEIVGGTMGCPFTLEIASR